MYFNLYFPSSWIIYDDPYKVVNIFNPILLFNQLQFQLYLTYFQFNPTYAKNLPIINKNRFHSHHHEPYIYNSLDIIFATLSPPSQMCNNCVNRSILATKVLKKKVAAKASRAHVYTPRR